MERPLRVSDLEALISAVSDLAIAARWSIANQTGWVYDPAIQAITRVEDCIHNLKLQIQQQDYLVSDDRDLSRYGNHRAVEN